MGVLVGARRRVRWEEKRREGPSSNHSRSGKKRSCRASAWLRILISSVKVVMSFRVGNKIRFNAYGVRRTEY